MPVWRAAPAVYGVLPTGWSLSATLDGVETPGHPGREIGHVTVRFRDAPPNHRAAVHGSWAVTV